MGADRKQGIFLTFEGLDGSGKTTQIKRLAAWLTAQALPHLVTRQPGGTTTGDRIRNLLLDSKSAGLAPHTELAMMFADRAQAIQEVIAQDRLSSATASPTPPRPTRAEAAAWARKSCSSFTASFAVDCSLT